MAVDVDWYDAEKTIVLYTVEGKWTWDELYPQYRKAIDMEKSNPYRVDVIVDMRQSGPLPLNILTHLKNFSDRQPDNIGITVVVTTNSFMFAIYKAGCKFYANIQRYFAVTNTMEEALQMIEMQRTKEQAST